MNTINFWFPSQSTKKIKREAFAFKGEPVNRPAKACVILIHGLGEHCMRYLHVAQFFTDQGFNFYSFDQIGHGQTAVKNKKFGHAKMRDLLADVDNFKTIVQDENPDLPIFIIGHSMGGAIALEYALHYQPKINNLIISAPALRPGFKPSAIKLFFARMFYKLAPSITLGNDLELNHICRDPHVIESYQADPLVSNLISPQLALDVLQTGESLLNSTAQNFSV